jgi:hypothetical protein
MLIVMTKKSTGRGSLADCYRRVHYSMIVEFDSITDFFYKAERRNSNVLTTGNGQMITLQMIFDRWNIKLTVAISVELRQQHVFFVSFVPLNNRYVTMRSIFISFEAKESHF